MRVGIYARVSSDAQQARGTIGSQLETLRARIAAEGDEVVAEFIDDGYSGARLDRPGLDALRRRRRSGHHRRRVVSLAGPSGPLLRLPDPHPRRTGPLRRAGALR